MFNTSPVGLDLHKARTHRLQVSPKTRFRDRVFSLRGSSHGDGPPRSRVPRATRGVTRRCDTPRFTRSLKSAIVCRMFDIYRHEGTSSACLAFSSFPTTHGIGTSQNEGFCQNPEPARGNFSLRDTPCLLQAFGPQTCTARHGVSLAAPRFERAAVLWRAGACPVQYPRLRHPNRLPPRRDEPRQTPCFFRSRKATYPPTDCADLPCLPSSVPLRTLVSCRVATLHKHSTPPP